MSEAQDVPGADTMRMKVAALRASGVDGTYYERRSAYRRAIMIVGVTAALLFIVAHLMALTSLRTELNLRNERVSELITLQQDAVQLLRENQDELHELRVTVRELEERVEILRRQVEDLGGVPRVPG